MAERRIGVAYSGGRDSTALLHATLQQAARDDVRVVALHVHHGLSPSADAWLSRCAAQCARWARRGLPVEFAAHRVVGAPAPGESVEAWAREARYRALGAMAHAHRLTMVLLGHHRRDQAETLLLQALRGAGVAGLAGMPRSVERDGITWHRPWLDRPRAEIDAYVRRHRLRFVDDDSNTDRRFARNRLRVEVWPALSAAFEQAEAALAASAAWAQQATAVLDEIAALDLEHIGGAGDLSIGDWLALSPARRSNALRAWLRRHQHRSAPASLVTRLLEELPTARSGRWPVNGGELRAHRGRLSFVALPRDPIVDALDASGAAEATGDTSLSVRRAGRYPLPGWHGVLQVERVKQGGVPLAWLGCAELRRRSGGERFQAGPGRPPRSLKKQYQAAGVPMWSRDGPLIYSGGQLVFVPGLGLDARVIGLPGQALVTLRWLPFAAPG